MDDRKVYTPAETAKILGISTLTLREMRRMGRIQGTFIGNTTLYTQEQIDNAELPRPKKKTPKKTPPTQTNGDEPSSLAAAS